MTSSELADSKCIEGVRVIVSKRKIDLSGIFLDMVCNRFDHLDTIGNRRTEACRSVMGLQGNTVALYNSCDI